MLIFMFVILTKKKRQKSIITFHIFFWGCFVSDRKIGWSVSLGLTAFSLSSRLPERERKKRETIGETRKVFVQALLAPTASTTGPCLTIIQSESYSAPTPADRKNPK